MKNHIKKIMFCIFFILALGFIYGAYQINTTYKQVKLEEIPLGEIHELIEGIQMKVNELAIIDKEELRNRYGYNMDYEGDIKGFFVSVTYTNESDKTQMIAAYNNNIERVGYSNGIDPIPYSMCNKDGLDFELRKGESKDIILTYILMDFQFTKQLWMKIKKEAFVLTTSRYPIKTNWLLK